MNKNTRHGLLSFWLAFSLILFGAAMPTPTRAEVLVNTVIDYSDVVPIPCAGENVFISGRLHLLIIEQYDANGGIHYKFHGQPQGMTGIGLVSGNTWHATGLTQGHTNVHSGLPFEDTYVNNYRIIGSGPGNNFLVHEVFHITVNANGDVTANVVNASVECK